MAKLNGYGFSYHKSQIAIMIVQNIHFKRNWKPIKYANLMKKFEAFSYRLMAKELIREKEGKVIKYFIDSATQKYFGTCATLGLHFNSDKYPHLPTTNITLNFKS